MAWWYSIIVKTISATEQGGSAGKTPEAPLRLSGKGTDTMTHPPLDPLAYSVPVFCKSVGISVRTFWSLQKSGDGPPVTRIGRRVLIRRQAAEAWLANREERTAA